MKKLIYYICFSFCLFQLSAQDKIIVANFYQVGTVPLTYDSSTNSKRLNANSVIFNFSSNGGGKFFRADFSWLFKRLLTGKDTLQRDTTIISGLNLPVFSFSVGWNVLENDQFSLGFGVNMDTRNYFGNRQNQVGVMIDAFQTGVIVATKVKINDRFTYSGFYGYDFMFTGKRLDADGKRNIYFSNNISYRFLNSLSINIQPDISFKSYQESGKNKHSNFTNQSIKFGIALMLD